MPAKKTPMRMCLGCREMHPKKELLRIVRTPDGSVKMDLTGKVSGRGAYICAKQACLDKASRSRAIERALEVGLNEDVLSMLREGIDKGDG